MTVYELVRDELIAADLGLTPANCYVSAVTFDLPGSHPFYVQVVPNGSDDAGVEVGGEQAQGSLTERVGLKLSVFVHMSLDQERRTQQALVQDSAGLLGRVDALRDALIGTMLEEAGEPTLVSGLFWTSTTPPVSYPDDPSWVSVDLMFAGYIYKQIDLQ